jgi:hypothetical protein
MCQEEKEEEGERRRRTIAVSPAHPHVEVICRYYSLYSNEAFNMFFENLIIGVAIEPLLT